MSLQYLTSSPLFVCNCIVAGRGSCFKVSDNHRMIRFAYIVCCMIDPMAR